MAATGPDDKPGPTPRLSAARHPLGFGS